MSIYEEIDIVLFGESAKWKRMGVDMPSIMSRLRSYAEDGDKYISFVSISKIGINPTSEYETPYGIYTYQMNDWFKVALERQVRRQDGGIPFASEQPIIYILTHRPVGRRSLILLDRSANASNYSESDFDADMEALKNEYMDALAVQGFDDIDMRRWAADAKYKTPFAKLWNVTRNMAQVLTRHGFNFVQKNGELQKSYKASMLWNKILRSLGIDGVEDNGSGLIHANEPYQTVFLSIKTIKVVSEMKNPLDKESIGSIVKSEVIKSTMSKIKEKFSAVVRKDDLLYHHLFKMDKPHDGGYDKMSIDGLIRPVLLFDFVDRCIKAGGIPERIDGETVFDMSAPDAHRRTLDVARSAYEAFIKIAQRMEEYIACKDSNSLMILIFRKSFGVFDKKTSPITYSFGKDTISYNYERINISRTVNIDEFDVDFDCRTRVVVNASGVFIDRLNMDLSKKSKAPPPRQDSLTFNFKSLRIEECNIEVEDWQPSNTEIIEIATQCIGNTFGASPSRIYFTSGISLLSYGALRRKVRV
jgi:hypothetical protein